MQPGGNTRSPPVPRLVLATTLLLGGSAACAGTTGRAGDDPTVDRILHQLDETSRQRTADAQRIEDLSRRVAVLETLLQDERNRAAAARAAAPPAVPAPGAPAGDAGEPPSPLPVVRLAPPGPDATTGNLALAQGTAARAAPDVVEVEEPAPREPADELADIPYQGVGFGNGGGDGYLRIGASDASTIRLVGASRRAGGAQTATAVPTVPGGTPSAAFGPVPRIPPMVPTAPAAETVATPAASATGAYQSGIEAYRGRRWQEAIGWFERALAQGLDESKAALALFFQAEATFQTRTYVEAIGLFERFLDRHPGHPREAEALLRLGTASERLGDVERAVELYRRVVAEHPASPAAATAAARLEAATGTEGRQP